MPEGQIFSLRGKTVIQLGGSGTLGRALVSALACAGATLIVASRQRAALAAVAAAERVMYSVSGMLWKFEFDTARHLYDEVRHCLMGYEWMRRHGMNPFESPQYLHVYQWRSQFPPGNAVLPADDGQRGPRVPLPATAGSGATRNRGISRASSSSAATSPTRPSTSGSAIAGPQSCSRRSARRIRW